MSFKAGLEAGSRRPALDRHIDIVRVDVEPPKAPPGPLGGEQRRPRAQKEIQHEIAVPGHILDRIGNQPVGLTVGCKARSSRRLPRIELTEA